MNTSNTMVKFKAFEKLLTDLIRVIQHLCETRKIIIHELSFRSELFALGLVFVEKLCKSLINQSVLLEVQVCMYLQTKAALQASATNSWIANTPTR